jgi:hypothetical protein
VIGYLTGLDWPTIAIHALWLGVGVLIGFLIASIMAMGGRLSEGEEWASFQAPDPAPDLEAEAWTRAGEVEP